MQDRTSNIDQPIAYVPTGRTSMEDDVTGTTDDASRQEAELADRGYTWTPEGVRLRRLDWMTDAQWQYIETSMSHWWDGFLAGLETGRETGR